MIAATVLVAGLGLIALAFYKWVTLNNDYFAKRSVPFIKPTFLLGASGGMILKLHRMDTWCKWMYNEYCDAGIVGMFNFRQPFYLLRDPAIIKQLAVKDFDYFEDHQIFIDPSVDRLVGNCLIILRGQKWRDMRATLSPAFTGSKMRLMFIMLNDCASQLVQVLCRRAAASGANASPHKPAAMRVDTKDMFSRFATDVIATAAFGIEVNSFENERNEFFVNCQRAVDFATVQTVVKLLLMQTWPALMRWLDIPFIDSGASEFFRTMALDTIRTRLERNIHRPDLVNLLIQLKAAAMVEGGTKGGSLKSNRLEENAALHNDGDAEPLASDSAGFATVEESHIGRQRCQRQWTDTDLAAQCFLFFTAGFDTTSSLMSFMSYELALNPVAQQRLYDECCATRDLLDGSGDTLTYDTLHGLQYMDQVVSETLRMWPPVVIVDRVCVRDYRFDDGRMRFDVRPGTSLWIPIYALHHDARYFPEPDTFRPERFGVEERTRIVAGTYLPFGVGPRNCIGSRFALMEVKAIMYHIVLHFSIERTAETPVPMRLAVTNGALKPYRDIVLAFRRRLG